MAELIEFKISRKDWIRGEGSEKSALIVTTDGSNKGKKCCVGFQSLTAGLEEADLCGQGTVVDVYNYKISKGVTYNLPDSLKCMIVSYPFGDDEYENTTEAREIYAANDAICLSDEAREIRLTELFAEIGWKPIFVD
jgi:hypothetical protein